MADHAWVAEWLSQFLRSPVWTCPVQTYIDENCEIFEDSDEEEHKLEYKKVHQEFCELVDGLLSDNLKDLGIGQDVFLEVVGSKDLNEDLDSLVREYLLSMDDFLTFRKMMEKRNIEIELETMQALDSAGDDELEMALAASAQAHELSAKELEMEDAELQHALAISLAAEEERQQLREQEIAKEASSKAEQQKIIEESKKEHSERVARIEEEVLQKRIEVASKAPEVQAVVQSTPSKNEEPAPTPPKPKPVSPPPAQTQQTATLDRVQLAPLMGNSQQNQAFAAKKPLPGITASSRPTFTALKTAVVEEAKKEAPPESTTREPLVDPRKAQPSEDQLKMRENYLREQRDRLLKQKKQRRDSELDTYLRENTQTPKKEEPAPGVAPNRGIIDQEHLEMRRALAKKVKEDLLSQ
eukprot:TRINITY_DN867_c5_g1_i1.p1 TRINITY_DN867_c5_g1~~TRINITY_DN867_c5_g1_i1.p1  ORF type:complete len:434 (+),score=128.06 TRINITY_DN867_c5_g1_i1:68-1303(+)